MGDIEKEREREREREREGERGREEGVPEEDVRTVQNIYEGAITQLKSNAG